MNKTKNLFLWPRENFAPPSLFKHYIYLGEMAGIANKYSDTDIIDLSVQNITRQEFVSRINVADNIFIPTEVYTARKIVDFIPYIRNYTNANIIGYSTAIALNPKIFEPYFDYLITSGFRGNIIKDLVTKDYSNLSIDNKVISHKTKPSNIEWGSSLFNKLPMDEFLKISKNEVEISMQIGCKYNCGFCMEKIFHPNSFIENRPINDIINFLNTNTYDKYFFDATTFTIDKNWVLELSKSIKTNIKRPIKWRTVSRVDCIDEEICKAMSDAGCYQIGLGIESLSPNVQKGMNKVIKEKDVLKVFSMLLRNGINPRGFFILGLPNQTNEDVEYCQEFIKRNN
ncbi:MAG: radical SAM protein, partial [Bacteroidales bacterium]|nr:radical SAM protein [Bacteroidales bacterium]